MFVCGRVRVDVVDKVWVCAGVCVGGCVDSTVFEWTVFEYTCKRVRESVWVYVYVCGYVCG